MTFGSGRLPQLPNQSALFNAESNCDHYLVNLFIHRRRIPAVTSMTKYCRGYRRRFNLSTYSISGDNFANSAFKSAIASRIKS